MQNHNTSKLNQDFTYLSPPCYHVFHYFLLRATFFASQEVEETLSNHLQGLSFLELPSFNVFFFVAVAIARQNQDWLGLIN